MAESRFGSSFRESGHLVRAGPKSFGSGVEFAWPGPRGRGNRAQGGFGELLWVAGRAVGGRDLPPFFCFLFCCCCGFEGTPRYSGGLLQKLAHPELLKPGETEEETFAIWCGHVPFTFVALV